MHREMGKKKVVSRSRGFMNIKVLEAGECQKNNANIETIRVKGKNGAIRAPWVKSGGGARKGAKGGKVYYPSRKKV